MAGARLARTAPDVIAALSRLDGAIDTDRMRAMNFEVDDQGEDPMAVAARFVATLDAR